MILDQPRGAVLLHPAALAALATLLINDHLLKRVMPGLLSGKLSDLAGLFLFPLFLAALWELASGRSARTPAVWIGVALATNLVFAAIKLSPLAGDLYRVGLGLLRWPLLAAAALLGGAELPAPGMVALVADPTDLVALPASWVAVLRFLRE